MNKEMLQTMVTMLLGTLTDDLVKQFGDMALDFVEDKVLGSKSKVDDAVVLPICAKIRAITGIPDNDTPNTEPVG